MRTTNQHYSIKPEDGFIHEVLYGAISHDDVLETTQTILALHESAGLKRLLCDMTDLDVDNIDLHARAAALGLLWELRDFDKIAFVAIDPRVQKFAGGSSNFSSLRRFRMFKHAGPAKRWLAEA